MKINAKFETYEMVFSEDLAYKNLFKFDLLNKFVIEQYNKNNNPVLIIGKNCTSVRMF